MENKINLKAIIVGLVLLLIGIGLILFDIFCVKTTQNLWISIGCSLIASGLVALFNSIFVERDVKSPLDDWKIAKIYERRSEKSKDSDPKIKELKHNLDVVAFGLKSFRNKHTEDIKKCLENGTNIRVITMNPNSQFVKQREIEEEETEGQIKNTIEQLVEWARKINSKTKSKNSGRIEIRSYDCMTLDFYWRMDNELYIGPYWFGISSQQTITYKFVEGGIGFKMYSEYFEKLWESCKNNVIV